VKQTQKVAGHVGIFHVPWISRYNASGREAANVAVSKEAETFLLPSDSAPLMVLFDKGGQI